jgi:hypothetical protein
VTAGKELQRQVSSLGKEGGEVKERLERLTKVAKKKAAESDEMQVGAEGRGCAEER